MSEAKGIVLAPGLVLTIVLTLVAYGIGGVWWASNVQAKIDSMLQDATEYRDGNDEENLRLWARINTAEGGISDALASDRALTAIVERVEEDIRLMRTEQRITNDLLREALVSAARSDGNGRAINGTAP